MQRRPAALDTSRLSFAVSIVEIGCALILFFNPGQFPVTDDPALVPWLSALFLTGGVTLLMLIRYGIGRWGFRLLTLLPAAPLLLAAWLNRAEPVPCSFFLALGLVVGGLPLWARGAGEETGDRRDLFEVVHGIFALVMGALMLIEPGTFPHDIFAPISPYIRGLGALAIIGGIGLLAGAPLGLVQRWLPHLTRAAAVSVTVILTVNFFRTGLQLGALFNLGFGLPLLSRPIRAKFGPSADALARVERSVEGWIWLVVIVAVFMALLDDPSSVDALMRVSSTVLALTAYNVTAFWILPRFGTLPNRVRMHLTIFVAGIVLLMLDRSLVAQGITVAIVVPPMLAARAFGEREGYHVLAIVLLSLLLGMLARTLRGQGDTVPVNLVRLVGVAMAGWMVTSSAAEQRRTERELQSAQEELQTMNEELLAQNEELTQAGQSLVRLAERDPLTGLFNRRRFSEYLEDEAAHRSGVLLFLDLDQFKEINDALGHAAGDQVLEEVARALTEEARAGQIAARFGGDEFALLMPGSALSDGTELSVRILKRLAGIDPFGGQTPFRVSASIGITRYPEDGRTLEELLIQADMAMYHVKNTGRNGFATAGQRQETQRISWERELEAALAEGQLRLHYQPIMDLRSRTIDRYEVLLRMAAGDGRLVKPERFLPFVEHRPVMHQIDRWVIRHALEALQRGQANGCTFPLQINVSGRAFEDGDLLGLIRSWLAETGVAPASVVFEITETVAIKDLARARAFMQALKELGCRFAMDDLGSGFASLTCLKHLPVDYIKIDGALMENLSHGPNQALVEGLVAIARGMGMQTIAEWVEDAETLELLAACGVDYAQGYLIGHPSESLPATSPSASGAR